MSDLKGLKILIDSEDVDRLVTFYSKTFGLEVTENSEHWGSVQFGTASIGLHHGGDASKSVTTALSFTVADIHAAGKRVEENGGAVVQAPYDPGEGGFLLATFRDPEKNTFMASQDL